MCFPVPEDEAARLECLRSYTILDTPSEQAFDDITRLASYICGTPISLVSLLDDTRQWFKSSVGLAATETPRDQAFCGHAILQDGLMVVPNALEDARFAANPLVTGEPHIRFYAGTPLVMPSGQALGTLCVIDRVPRTLTREQEESLRALGRQVVALLELRRNITTLERVSVAKERIWQERQEAATLQKAILDSADYSIISTDVHGTILSFNRAAERMTGYRAQEVVGKFSPSLLHDADEVIARAESLAQELGRSITPGFEVFTAKIGEDTPDENEWTYIRKDGSRFPIQLSATAVRNEDGVLTGYLGVAHDITARKQVELELHKSQEQLEAAQQIAHLGSWEYDLTTQNVTWSKELFRLFDMNPEQGELNYAAAVRLYSPEDAARLDACFQRSLTEGIGYEMDLQRAISEGVPPRWYHTVGKPVFDAQGNLIRMAGTLIDITERKRAEAALQEAHNRLESRVQARTKALQESEALFRATFAQAAVGMARVSLDGKWLDVNDKLCELVGYSREELSALTFQDITYPDDLNTDLTHVAQVIAGETAAYSMEKRYIRKDGALVWINLTVALVREADGTPQYFISIVEDISARKKAQEALQDSETRYRFLADAMPQIVWTAGPDGNLNFYNQRWFDYTGMTLEETLGWGWQPIVHSDDLHNCVNRWTRAYTAGEPYEVEYRFKRAADGVYRWHLGRALPLRNETGEIIQWVGTCTDIDEFKQAQDYLERGIRQRTERLVIQQEDLRASEAGLRILSRELARSNTDLEQFAYVASHDLQEPLRMIGSYLELLNLEYSERLDDEAREYIAYAVDGAVRMKALINDLLAYSRVGTQGKPMQQIAVSSLLREVLTDLHLRILETNAIVTCDPLPTVSADASQLRLVFQNLIGNALKFHGMQTPRIHVSATQGEGEWQFAVMDNGIGMQAKHLERIFVIFQRLHSKSKYPGTGIGLATCKRVVERHGGRIWVESEPGSGTTFFFTLPSLNLLPVPDNDLDTQEAGENCQ